MITLFLLKLSSFSHSYNLIFSPSPSRQNFKRFQQDSIDFLDFHCLLQVTTWSMILYDCNYNTEIDMKDTLELSNSSEIQSKQVHYYLEEIPLFDFYAHLLLRLSKLL